ncbi:MAG: response regulator transcription factor [Phycisphaerales bacterium]
MLGTILIIEDDPAIRRGLVDTVTFAGYRGVECSNGSTALATAIETSPDLVLLDVLLPGRSGFDILRDLREQYSALPIIMVTARGSEGDRVDGLTGGADDYIIKPFSPRELLARIEAVLRRSPGRTAALGIIRSCDGSVVIDLDRRESHVAGDCRALSEREAAILSYLAAHRERAVSRDELLHHVWGLDPRGLHTRTVDMHIARLRDRIGDNTSPSPLIVTVRGCGYMLASDAQLQAPERSAS